MPNYLIILCCCICFGSWAKAQDSLQLKIIYIDKDSAQFPPVFSTPKNLPQAIAQLSEKGYLSAYIDTIFPPDSQSIAKAYLVAGERYEWANLEAGNVPPVWLDKAGFRPNQFGKNQLFSPKELAKIRDKILVQAENVGYPFAQISLENIVLDANTIRARFFLDRGEAFRIQKFVIESDTGKNNQARIHRKYLEHYLGIRRGDYYNESTIQKIRTRLNALPFLQMRQSPSIVFENGKADVYLFLNPKRASRFDFLVGLQPAANQGVNLPRFSFTGNVLMDLVNVLGRGERLMINWQRLQTNVSQLKTKLVLPYIFNTSIGIDANFDIYKRDSSYIDIISDLGANYLLEGGNHFKIFWKTNTTNLLSIDSNLIKQSRRLPTTLDLRHNWFGLEYYLNRLDYRFNPRKGTETRLNASAGVKQIRKNTSILNLRDANVPDFSFESLYDSLQMVSYQLKIQAENTIFIPIFKQATLVNRISAASIFGENLYQNELFRIGGNKLQRGFDEEKIYASQYAICTFEARYLLATNSYLFAFVEGGVVKNKSVVSNTLKYPYSFGIGLALDTKAGIIGLSYALGTYTDQPLIVRNAKIHIGYLSLF
jgi:outer membrane protein assembly factor BamA